MGNKPWGQDVQGLVGALVLTLKALQSQLRLHYFRVRVEAVGELRVIDRAKVH